MKAKEFVMLFKNDEGENDIFVTCQYMEKEARKYMKDRKFNAISCFESRGCLHVELQFGIRYCHFQMDGTFEALDWLRDVIGRCLKVVVTWTNAFDPDIDVLAPRIVMFPQEVDTKYYCVNEPHNCKPLIKFMEEVGLPDFQLSHIRTILPDKYVPTGIEEDALPISDGHKAVIGIENISNQLKEILENINIWRKFHDNVE